MGRRYSNKEWKYDTSCDGFQPGSVSWEYTTVTDIFSFRFKEEETQCWGGILPAREHSQSYTNEQIHAMYNCLKHFFGDDKQNPQEAESESK